MAVESEVRGLKANSSIEYFLNEMIKREELRAYRVQINKRTIERDDEDELVVRVKKGVSLTPIERLGSYYPYILEDTSTGNKYHLFMEGHGGVISEYGDQTIYDNCLVEKLKDPDFRKISVIMGDGRLGIPDEMVETRIRTSYSTDFEALSDVDVPVGHDGHVKVEGREESDPFLEKFYNFLQS